MLSMSNFGDPMHPGDVMPESSIGTVALGKVGACTVGFEALWTEMSGTPGRHPPRCGVRSGLDMHTAPRHRRPGDIFTLSERGT